MTNPFEPPADDPTPHRPKPEDDGALKEKRLDSLPWWVHLVVVIVAGLLIGFFAPFVVGLLIGSFFVGVLIGWCQAC